MASVTNISIVLALLLTAVHTEEDFIHFGEEGEEAFALLCIEEDEIKANYCLVFQIRAGEDRMLWNSSELSPDNATLETDLRHRLEVKYSCLVISNLKESDSGRYRVDCWRDGQVTLQRKLTLFVCGTVTFFEYRMVSELQCNREKSGENIHWFHTKRYWSNMLRIGAQITQTRFAETGPFLNVRSLNDGVFSCFVLEDEQCLRGQRIYIESTAFLLGSVRESASLPCFDNDPNTTEITWIMEANNPLTSLNPNHSLASQSQMYMMDGQRSGNYSLIIPSLKLDTRQKYSCRKNPSNQLIADYKLVVCPKFDPVTVFFSQGESAVLKCNADITEISNTMWFRKTAERDYQLLFYFNDIVYPLDLEAKLNMSMLPSSLILSNLSQKDSGEYLCAVIHAHFCVSGTKILLTFVDSDMYGFSSTLYTVRSAVLSSGLLGMICAVIAVNVSICRRNQEHNQGDKK